MQSGQAPTNAGSYRFVVTVSINEADRDLYVLPNGENTVTFSFDFEIQKKVIDISSFGFAEDVEFNFDGSAHTLDFHGYGNEFINYGVIEYYKPNSDGPGLTSIDEPVPVYRGYYTCRIWLSIKPEYSANCVFSDGKTTTIIQGTYSIVQAPTT